MFKQFTDKKGKVWNLIESWSDLGVVEGGQKYVKCPICSNGRKYNKEQKCLTIRYDRKTAFCNHCPERYMLKTDDEYVKPEKHEIKKEYRKPEVNIMRDFPVNIIKFLYERGFTDDVIKRNKLGHDVKYFGKSKKNCPCVSIPYYKNGELVGVKYRTNPKDWTAETGTEPILYGYDDIEESCLIWVEGEFDKLAIEEAGYKSCVSVPNGAKSAGCLDNVIDKIKPVKVHIIAVDNDLDGNQLKNELIRRLNPAKCRTVKFTEGCKDANDVLKNHGPDELKRCIDENVKVPIKGIIKPSALLEKLIDSYRSGSDEGLSTGWLNLDKLYRVKTGQWTVITGIPNHGKSEFLDALMCNMIIHHRWKFGIFSPENAPTEKHMSKILRKMVNKPFGIGYNGTMTEQEISETTMAFDDHITFVASDEDVHSMDSLLKITEDLVLSEGINAMIIDPWNTIEHNIPNGSTETTYISSALSKVTLLCRKHDIHIFVVAHPTKMQKKAGTNKYLVPLPYDISGSAHWNNKADNAISVYIDSGDDIPENQVQIHVTKIRFRDNGQPGQTELYYQKASGRYTTGE